ncbi:hypothetical protein [Peterkaempfera griseoplana]|uniref:hypothetical protein n=1 Tax=Peterkaempfera griseoplana TaxID=66896 RepID=UPI0012FF1B14|nr:hypothetical protein [Peterkaempfera griseoplana]
MTVVITAIIRPHDAVILVSAACVRGSGLWPRPGIAPVAAITATGHTYVGTVEEARGRRRPSCSGQS